MERKKLKVCWMSAGVSSFIAGYLERDTSDHQTEKGGEQE